MAVFALTVVRAPAQSQPPSARPRLPAGADTNDATAYLRFANGLQLDTSPDARAVAESAYVWAARLAPGNADPLYARGVAILRRLYRGAFYRALLSRRPDSLNKTDVDLASALMRQAWLRDPFRDAMLDPELQLGALPRASDVSDPELKGFLEYFAADLPKARDAWARALRKAPDRVDLRFHRAYSYYLEQHFDSAAAELDTALAAMGKADSAVVRFAPPRDLLYYALGVAREQAGDTAGARDAYTKALSEDLGLYYAHARLARLVLGQGDTTGALTELSLAAGVEPHDAWIRNYYGFVLLATGRYSQALEELQAARDADPWYASPYYLLGRTYEALGQAEPAFHSYREFLTHAAVTDPRWSWTTLRLGELQIILRDSSAHDD